jgi:hypothetical protein
MSKATNATHARPTVYAIPEHAHLALVQVKFFLSMMARLTEPGTNASRHDAQLRPDSLAWCFSSLSKEIDAIVGATYYSNEVAGMAEARNRRRTNA